MDPDVEAYLFEILRDIKTKCDITGSDVDDIIDFVKKILGSITEIKKFKDSLDVLLIDVRQIQSALLEANKFKKNLAGIEKALLLFVEYQERNYRPK